MTTYAAIGMTTIMTRMKKAPSSLVPVIAIDRTAKKPLHRQIYEGYRDAIVERRFRAGQRMPSTRSLAAELGVSRIPVLNAFEQLLAEGYFETRVGAGTFVARSLPVDVPRVSAAAGGTARPGGVSCPGRGRCLRGRSRTHGCGARALSG